MVVMIVIDTLEVWGVRMVVMIVTGTAGKDSGDDCVRYGGGAGVRTVVMIVIDTVAVGELCWRLYGFCVGVL